MDEQELDEEKLKYRINILVSLLDNYGGHHGWCDVPEYARRNLNKPCTCGFTSALKAVQEWREVISYDRAA